MVSFPCPQVGLLVDLRQMSAVARSRVAIAAVILACTYGLMLLDLISRALVSVLGSMAAVAAVTAIQVCVCGEGEGGHVSRSAIHIWPFVINGIIASPCLDPPPDPRSIPSVRTEHQGGSSLSEVLQGVDLNTLGLLFGMMLMVGMLGTTGMIEWCAVRAAALSRGSPWRLLLLMGAVTWVMGALMDCE